MDHFFGFVEYIKQSGFYPNFDVIEEGVNEPNCTIEGKRYLMFSSNNYLGLTQEPSVKEAGKAAIDKYGVGPGGSRVISGNVDIIETLEKEISALTRTESTLTFPTGYMANIGAFSALMDSGIGELFGYGSFNTGEAKIFSDEFNHGSIVDGCRLSNVPKVIFKHNDLDDLRRKLHSNPVDRKLIVTEGVFSLEGEITPIDKMVEIARENDALLMVDDAHGVGILGENGGGVGEYFNCSPDIDVLMGCMDKAFGGTGGYLSGTKSMIDYLKVSARSSLLSSAIPTGMAGAMVESVKQIRMHKDRRDKILASSSYLRSSLIDSGFKILGKDNIPAVPLYIGNDRIGLEFEKRLNGHGIYCQLARWPAVPIGTARFRIIVMAQHEKAHLDALIQACKTIGKDLKMI